MDYFYPTLLAGIFGGGYYMYYYGINNIKGYMIESAIEYLKNKNNSNRDNVSFKQFGKSQSAIVMFEYGGKQSKVHIPYNRRKMVSMMRKKVFLIRPTKDTDEEDEKIEITHKPGVPYLLSAREMGGNKIIVKKDNDIIQTYDVDDTPNYL